MMKQENTRRGRRPPLAAWLAILIIAALAAAALWYGHAGFFDGKLAPKATPTSTGPDRAGFPVPVATAQARIGDIKVYLDALGTVTAARTVTVGSRVDGQFMTQRFHEGTLVKEGDVIAELDPRPYQVQVDQAEGQLAKDVALLANAKVDLKRYRTLLAQDSIAEQQLATQESLVRQYEGSVAADKGQLANARLQLTYSRITAPISGKIGLAQVDVGNIVHATDANGIALITEVQPIDVIFSVPGDYVGQIAEQSRTGQEMTVEAWNRDKTRLLATGKLDTMDNQIDPTTATVKLKSEFANEDNALFPNQFVNARLLMKVDRGGVIIPSAAILHGAQGAYVYLVNADRTVTPRPTRTGAVQGDDTEILAGLGADDQVVVDGMDKLRDGSRIQPVPRNTVPAQASTSAP